MQVNDLNLLLVQLLQQKNYKNCEIIYNSANEFGHGFLSNMTFVKVRCDTDNGKKQQLNLAVKKSTDNEVFREALNIGNIFKQEVYFYDTVFPVLMQFQSRTEARNCFNSIPRFYGAFNKDNIELIIFDDLNAKGYSLCDRKQPMDLEHLKLALIEYGRFHALSLAMNHQEQKHFRDVKDKLGNQIKDHFKRETYWVIPKLFQQVLELLQRRSEDELYGKLKNLVDKKPVTQQAIDLMGETTPYAVINHCDSWMNNIMFQYKDEEKQIPSKLTIFDWQLVSVLNSPIYDLSFLLFVCGSVEDLENLKELLNIYYNSVHTFMKELGTDPDEVFPYETFLEHWRKYSLFGFTVAPMSMKFLFADDGDLPEEVKTVADTYDWIINMDIENKGYADRIIGICKRFFYNNI